MCRTGRHGRIGASIAAALMLASSQLFAQEAQAAVVKFNIESQPLAQALNIWADQAGMQIIWPVGDPVAYHSAPPIRGRLEPMEALRVLLEDTGLTYSLISGGQTVAIHGREPSTVRTAANDVTSGQTPAADRMAQAAGQLPARGARTAPSASSTTHQPARGGAPHADDVEELEEIVVTGTHIRGVRDAASPVHIFTRADIEQSGVGTVQEFVKRIPQNFNGGVSEETILGTTGGTGSSQSSYSSTVNLRGLGSNSTLTLINGRRVAPGDFSGDVVDISLIPMNAVERIEVLTDGASASYGSDAVGGVVNFILRRTFHDPETRLRYAAASDGATDEIQAGQTLGGNWSSGSALLSYEYLDRSPLDGRDRGVVIPTETHFLPKQRRQGALLTVRQELPSGIELQGDAIGSRRYTYSQLSDGGVSPSINHRREIDTYSTTLAARKSFSGRTYLDLSAGYSQSDSYEFGYFPEFELVGQDRDLTSTVWSLDAKLDGVLTSVRAGEVKYAFGSQYRNERYKRLDHLSGDLGSFENDRNVVSAFAELHIPLLASTSTERDQSRLALVLADRYESYSDFGSANDPKVGLVWNVIPALKARGTYGKSFRAPSLNSLDERTTQIIASTMVDPASAGDTDVVTLFGGNPDLQPEKATSWTVGLDLNPPYSATWRASATYYNIRYKQRIVDPISVIEGNDILANEAILGSQIVQRNPARSFVELLAADPNFLDFRIVNNGDLSTIGAFVDYRTRNLSGVRTSGVDLGFSHTTGTFLGNLDIGLDGTYILEFDNQVTPRSASQSALNVPYQPVDLRLRAHGVLTRGGTSLSLFLNYTDSYKDNRFFVGEVTKVDSWFTLDASITHEFDSASSIFDGLSVTLSVLNLSDEDPPFLRNRFYIANYDGANANPLGRYVGLGLQKRW